MRREATSQRRTARSAARRAPRRRRRSACRRPVRRHGRRARRSAAARSATSPARFCDDLDRWRAAPADRNAGAEVDANPSGPVASSDWNVEDHDHHPARTSLAFARRPGWTLVAAMTFTGNFCQPQSLCASVVISFPTDVEALLIRRVARSSAGSSDASASVAWCRACRGLARNEVRRSASSLRLRPKCA